jgi:hypothetical protein
MGVRADAERKDAAIQFLEDTVKTLLGHNAVLRSEVEGLKGTAEKAEEKYGENWRR